MSSVRARLLEPVDGASLAAFRVLFGLTMFGAVVRFWARGFIDELYVAPRFHFSYWGFSAVEVLPSPWLHVVFVAMGAAALAIALGRAPRIAAGVFFVLFTYVELLDRATYLNHYYLVSLVSLLLVVLPTGARVPAYAVWALRTQIGLVYVFAGLAKLQPDWLVHAEPLRTWLAVHTDLPLVGRFMDDVWLAHVASVAGCCFDLFVVPALLWSRTRPAAYFALVAFHLITGALFHIGVFPFVMIACSTIFFPPSWPRRFVPRWTLPASSAPPHRAIVGLLGVHLALQLAVPLRQHFYEGDPRWTENGYRFAWNVMLMEKTGHVELEVRDPETGRRWIVHPRDELTELQAKSMATQPDMILAYAHHLERRFARCEGPGGACADDVEIHAEAYVSLNGRPSRRFIDPDVDLTAIEDDPVSAYAFVLPTP